MLAGAPAARETPRPIMILFVLSVSVSVSVVQSNAEGELPVMVRIVCSLFSRERALSINSFRVPLVSSSPRHTFVPIPRRAQSIVVAHHHHHHCGTVPSLCRPSRPSRSAMIAPPAKSPPRSGPRTSPDSLELACSCTCTCTSSCSSARSLARQVERQRPYVPPTRPPALRPPPSARRYLIPDTSHSPLAD